MDRYNAGSHVINCKCRRYTTSFPRLLRMGVNVCTWRIVGEVGVWKVYGKKFGNL